MSPVEEGRPINHSSAARKEGGWREDAAPAGLACHVEPTSTGPTRPWREGTAPVGSGVWEKPPLGCQLTYRGMGLPDPEPAVQASKEKKGKAT